MLFKLFIVQKMYIIYNIELHSHTFSLKYKI